MALPSLLWALNPENAAYCGEAKRLTNPLLRERNETRGQKKRESVRKKSKADWRGGQGLRRERELD